MDHQSSTAGTKVAPPNQRLSKRIEVFLFTLIALRKYSNVTDRWRSVIGSPVALGARPYWGRPT